MSNFTARQVTGGSAQISPAHPQEGLGSELTLPTFSHTDLFSQANSLHPSNISSVPSQWARSLSPSSPARLGQFWSHPWCWKLSRVPWGWKSVLNIHWKDWCWSWKSNTLATWWEELTLEKTPMLGKNEGGRRRGRLRMRWLDGITNSMDLCLSKLGSWWRAGGLACCSPWGRRVGHDWAATLNWFPPALLERRDRVKLTCGVPWTGKPGSLLTRTTCTVNTWVHRHTDFVSSGGSLGWLAW